MARTDRRFCAALPIVAAAGLLIVSPCPARAQVSGETATPTQAFLDGLRQRKLDRLIQVYCRQQLDRPDISPSEQAMYTIELANQLATRAQRSTVTSQRTELWHEASQYIAQLLARFPEHPQAATLRFQLGVYELAQGQLLRQQSELAPQDTALLKTTRDRLGGAVAALQGVDSEVTRSLNRQTAREAASAGAHSRRLRLLSENARFRLGQAQLALAQTFPRNSADFNQRALLAKAQFDAFTQRYSNNELVLESFLYKADVLRLLGQSGDAEKLLREIEQHRPATQYLDRALVLRAQIALDKKQSAAARNLIHDARPLLQTPIPELDLAYVHATLALARDQSQRGDPLAARETVAAALQAIDQIEKQHGAYWMARCELLLAELASEKLLVSDPRVLGRVAEGQFRRGDRAASVATLDDATKRAAERNEKDSAVELGIRAAAIVQQSGDLAAAAERFAQIASNYSNHPRAGEAQFLAVFCLGRAYAEKATSQALDAYDRALAQFLRMFPADRNAAEAQWLLGSLRLSQRRWSDAIEQWRAIPAAHGRFAGAQLEIARAYETWLQDLSDRDQPTSDVAQAASRFLKAAVATVNLNQPTAGDVQLLLRLSRTLLHGSVSRPREAEPLLQAIVRSGAAGESDRLEAQRLRVVALLGQNRFAEARKAVATEIADRPAELFPLLQILEDAASGSNDARRQQVGQLQLVAAERLAAHVERLSDDEKVRVQIALALAHVNAGESVRAQELFDQLRRRLPSNPRVIEAQAENLMRLGRYSQARELWRDYSTRVKPNTPEFFRAKYSLALACLRAGDAEQCRKIIGVLEVLHPQLGGLELKAKFDQLKADAAKALGSR
jgi:outer membrane protein assembly factor BamD (BamD/ComL family)